MPSVSSTTDNSRYYQQQINDLEDEYAAERKKAALAQDESKDKLSEAYEKKLADTVRISNEALAEQAAQQAAEKARMNEYVSRYKKEQGAGQAEAIQKYEAENRANLNHLQAGHERDMEDVRRGSDAAIARNAANHLEKLHEKDEYLTNVTHQMSQDAREQLQNERDEAERNQRAFVLQAEHDKESRDRAHAGQMQRLNEQHNQTLTEQARSYQDVMNRSNADKGAQIDRLQRELQTRATSADPNVISPAAEATVRNAVGGEYEKKFGAERERNERDRDSLSTNYNESYQNLVREKQINDTRTASQNAMDRHLERGALLAQLEDAQFQKEQALRNKDQESNQQGQNMTRTYAGSLDRQRQSYDEIINMQRNDANFRLNSKQQEAEFSERRAHREFAARESELVRQYEQKARMDKAQTDSEMEEIKLKAQVAVRESEHRAKQMLEDQARNYDQRIAQMEAQQKEHERYLQDNFNDQLEKVRESYALSRSQKS